VLVFASSQVRIEKVNFFANTFGNFIYFSLKKRMNGKVDKREILGDIIILGILSSKYLWESFEERKRKTKCRTRIMQCRHMVFFMT
jgi:hypothetical protein